MIDGQAVPLTHLGPVSVRRFMREYWQRRPLLVRGAMPGLTPPVGREQLFALAGRDDVESRLVLRTGSRWRVREGPFRRRALPPLGRSRWTLLVQGIDGLDAGVRALAGRFRFVPDARFDNVMASFASDGGGVGPHMDQYDVFLLQASGRRRWRISRQRHLALAPGQPLALVAGFRATREWLLEPGDLLYLPPGVPHEGTAVGECITYSVGFRAPRWAELHDAWLAAFAERTRVPGAYADAGERPAARPARLPPRMVERAHAALSRTRPGRAHTERFLLEYLSEPRREVVFARPPRPPAPGAFLRAARRRGLVLDLRTRMLAGRAGFGINGELVHIGGAGREHLDRLADTRRLPPSALARADAATVALLHGWLAAGWLHFGPATESQS